jgi:tyrocidine synthetase-3
MKASVSNRIVLSYWENISASGLFTDIIVPFKRFVEDSEAGGEKVITIPLKADVVASISRICNGSDLLIYNFYTTALGLLLSKYCQRNSLLILTPSLQRAGLPPDHCQCVQFNADIDASFKTLFSKGKEQLLSAMDNVIATDQLNLTAELGCVVSGINQEWGHYHPPVCINIVSGATPSISVKFDAGLFYTDLLELFLLNYHCLLGAIIEDLYIPVKDLDFQSEKELALIRQFNTPVNTFDTGRNMVLEMEDCLAADPDHMAFIFEERSLTYRQLNEQANKIAHFLLNTCGVNRNDVVGVCMDRSDEMAAVILGIWKSGAAYVPIDRAYPDQRKQDIIESSAVKIVFENNLPEGISEQPHTNPGVAIGDEDLAYVIYTSGTTGKPKGVMITHFGMRNHIGAKIADLHIQDNARIAQNAPHCFDISVWQFFAALIRRGTTYIYSNELVLDPIAFMKRISEDGINVLELVPSYFAIMLDVLDSAAQDIGFPHLQCLLLQAEPLLPSMVQRWYRHFPGIVIYNAYGITETSDDIAHYAVSRNENTLTIPVARGTIQHAGIYLVDEHLVPVPLGAKGEIIVAGKCVGKGYHNNPGQTALRFITGPVRGIPVHEKLYLSGDVARYLADGRLEFYGRKDAQVKIRGHRIEPGEIEVIMAGITGVEHAVVLPDLDNQLLVAYYTGAPQGSEELDNALRGRLPDYMVPSVFIRVDEFPLTPNGKIDRKQLTALAGAHTITNPAVTEEMDPLTRKVAGIWKDVIKRSNIGLQDDFFHIGGTSLLVMKLAAIYNREFDVRLPVSTLFGLRTVAAHVEAISHAGADQFERIEKIPLQEHYPLSDAQRRLWILSRFDKGSIAYNVPLNFSLKGKLDIDVFSRAIRLVVNRHEILRTVFREDATGTPAQYILEDQVVAIEVFDLRNNSNSEEVAAAYSTRLLNHQFDMENGPLYKIWLLQLADERYLCCLNIHHIICDGWSLDLLTNEILFSYECLLQGTVPQLPELSFQYKDYTSWQNGILNSPQLNPHRDYWMRALSGQLPVLELPTSRSRPAVKTYNGGKIHLDVPPHIVQSLEAFTQHRNTTPFVGLLSVLYALLARYTGQDDIILGSPVAGREHPELQNQVGFYVNTLALRVKVDITRSFESLFEQVRQVVNTAMQHQVYPFDVLVDDLKPERIPSRSPLFDVVVVMDNTTGKGSFANTRTNNTLEMEYQKEEHPYAKFDLNIMFNESPGCLKIAITFNSDLFDRSFIERMGTHLLQLMEKVLMNAQKALNTINYLSADEHAHTTTENYGMSDHIIARFEKNVMASPDAIAIRCKDQQLTYRQLSEKANDIAHALSTRIIEANEAIAIFLDRGIDYVCSILGILKAGAAYVPLDVNWPIDRTMYLLQDSHARIVITSTSCMPSLTNEVIGNALVLDRDLADLPGTGKVHPAIALSASDTAYFIYTSGTTGHPKGVMISHGNLAALFDAMQVKFDFGPQDVWTLFHSFCFDFSVWELWGPLLSGASVVIIPEMLAQDTNRFARLLQEEKITVLNQTPSAAYALMETIKGDETIEVSQLRYLIFGGEALHPGRLQWWNEQYPSVRNINMYGITETTVHVTFKEIGAGEISNNISAIGHPLPQWTCYVLDEYQLPLPIGIPGELYVGGPGVAKGYHNRPELNALRFIGLPGMEGVRLYRTGDKVKLRENGELEFIARLDDQVKIRGYRIELGEIENILQGSGYFTAIKVRVAETAEEKELVAYYIADTPVEVAVIRTYLRKSLPFYMVPSYFVRLDVMPLTANGKLDEKALAQIQPGQRIEAAGFVAPSGDVEVKLADIWNNILNVGQISKYDNFFEIGGHSLKATMLLAEIHRTFNIRLKLEDIFTDPTIAGLATLIQQIGQFSSTATSGGRRKIII